MLKHLYVKNFILIDEADLDFDTGFSVFTGETGAGKSILIDAISLRPAGPSRLSKRGSKGFDRRRL
ncbi:MAG: AAA family ATPase [Holdemania massiliensis]